LTKGNDMKAHLLLAASAALLLSACANTQGTSMNKPTPRTTGPSVEDIRAVSPGLARFTSQTIDAELWNRPGLSRRDRSVVTLAALIARNQKDELANQIELALQNGVKPGEVSEIITHLAFYSGMGNAMSAVTAAKAVFRQHGIDASQLPAAQGGLLPLDEKSEAARAERVDSNFGAVAPGVVEATTNVLFRDLWLRPGLSPRDRGLVTVSALIAVGQVAQVPVHLNKAMDNGLTQGEVSEALTQLAYYAGWPNVFSAMPVVKDVLAKRPG
jgi:4-carboxymuconolactone decarboxylase